MQPFDALKAALVDAECIARVRTFACGHVVDAARVRVLAVARGPAGTTLDYRFGSRSSTIVAHDTAAVLRNLARTVRGGIVVFFPSYAYCEELRKKWEQSGDLARIGASRPVFVEPRRTNEMERILSQYRAAACEQGAVLLCVVGGKLSEGINFNDDLGRVVVVVGLPFPNSADLEYQEKMRFLAERHGSSQAQEHSKLVCMKGVNQSIGRAIRHRNDYAAVVLLDQRYVSAAWAVGGLPAWMRPSYRACRDFASVMRELGPFWAAMRSASSS